MDSIMFVEMNLYVKLLDVHRVLCRRSGGQHHVGSGTTIDRATDQMYLQTNVRGVGVSSSELHNTPRSEGGQCPPDW